MSLSPGTLIPQVGFSHYIQDSNRPYYRGLVEGGVLGIIAGSLVTACCLALAWSHWGG